MKGRKKRFHKFMKKQQLTNDQKETKEEIPQEEIELHPELSRESIKETRPTRFPRHRYIPKEMVDRLNQQGYTNLVLGLAIVLGIIYIVFGILGILAIFGEVSWSFYQTTKILGWNQLKITGFVLVVIGIVMLWSVPLYFLNKTQQGDSYLVIASGLGILFGGIYILVIIADILNALITAITESSAVKIVTFFYIPIMLAIVAIPLFRILVIRHMVVLPDVGEDMPISAKWRKHQRGGHHFRKEWRTQWRKHFGRKKRNRKKNMK
jgi:hypothetical protein